MKIYFSHSKLEINHSKYTMQLGLGAFTLLTSLLGLCGYLSHWQYQRGLEKIALREAYAQQTKEHHSLRTLSVSLPNFTRVAVEGSYDVNHQFLMDNQHHKGQFGHHVITPFKLQHSNEIILVNRGFIPITDRAALPSLDTPLGHQQIEGRLWTPTLNTFVKETFDSSTSNWPLRIEKLKLDDLCSKLEIPCHAQLLVLEPGSTNYPAAELHIVELTPEKHTAYAIQWLAIGLAGAIILLIACTRRQQ
jgi:surfeit locus 1 family protein